MMKRSKTLPLPPSTLTTEKPLNKIRVPEIEYESESESGATGETREEASGDGGACERSCTPPVEEEEEDVKKMVCSYRSQGEMGGDTVILCKIRICNYMYNQD